MRRIPHTGTPVFAARLISREAAAGAARLSNRSSFMKRLSLVAACLLLSTPVFAQTPDRATTGAVPSQVSTADFVKKVAISDMFEIQAAQLALSKNADADTKPFAEKMVKDHQETTSELKQLVQSGKVKDEPPAALDDEHKKKLDELAKLSGKEFDTAYDRAQKEAHQEAVALFQSYAQNGDNADLKQWAAKTLPHLKEHLTMAEKLH
jgi:putative membrane protein